MHRMLPVTDILPQPDIRAISQFNWTRRTISMARPARMHQSDLYVTLLDCPAHHYFCLRQHVQSARALMLVDATRGVQAKH